ncbi:hypothetical protein R1flu_001319 [Riccia fluitans]|uniref:GTD-binding domain-containing protein n=1 Tax=Riccia fluitans TaxID=41844 RepID=A0ABD1Y3Y2_9MARC
MAWTYAENHLTSDRWKVTSLIWALVELVLGFTVLLCATVSIATTKALKALGLLYFSSYLPCEVDRERETVASQKDMEFSPNSQIKPRQVTASKPGRATDVSADGDMRFICGECSQRLSDCTCSARNQTDDLSADEPTTKDASVGGGKQSRGYCHSDANSELLSLSGRTVKRKFAKVFPRDGSPRNEAQGIVDSSPGIVKKSLVGGIQTRYSENREEEIVEDDEDAEPVRLMRNQTIVSDAGEADYIGKASWEESSGNSSHGSFTYIRGLPLNSARREGVSSESQFGRASRWGRGDVTPEWSGSYEVDEMDEKESSVANEEDDYDDGLEYRGVEELRDALRAERKALADLYADLEEERNASTTAANEAMAMITRLQEEKSAAQMEARHFQRMAEEKQMYDQEAIALLQDILLRRDQEVFNLEEEAKLYRQRLLELTMDELNKAEADPSGGPMKKTDFLLIERETLLLEADEEWRSKKDNREERLLAEIREWVTMANQKVAAQVPAVNVPAIKKEDEEEKLSQKSSKPSAMNASRKTLLESSVDAGRKNFLESSVNTGRENLLESSMAAGRQNFLESFSSIGGDEENRGNGGISEVGAEGEAGNEDSATRNDVGAPADYESFYSMMDSLRKEPRLRDEASLETLNKIEEKFQKQSGNGQVKSEDELRRIWKNTLRSFETSPAPSRSPNKQKQRNNSEDTEYSGLKSGIVRDAEFNRAMEQKKISVLEYVSKFEEQLHKGGAKKPAQQQQQFGRVTSNDGSKVEKPAPSASESRLDGQSLMELSAVESEKIKRCSSDRSRLPSSRFRRHSSDADRLQIRGEVSPSLRSAAVGFQEERSERPLRHEGNGARESSPVFDVYEVRRDTLEPSTPNRGSVYNGEIRKSASPTSNKLLHEEPAYSPDNDVYVEFLGDRLGKPKPLLGHRSSEPRANGKRSSYSQAGTGRCATSMGEDEISNQDFEWITTATVGRAARSDATKAAGVRSSQTLSTQADGVMGQLNARLKSLEADRQTMRETISSLKAENDEKQLLLEIAHQLREFRGMDQKRAYFLEPQELKPKDGTSAV